MNYEQSKNIVNITQNFFTLSPLIMSHRSNDELGTYILVT